jgi:AcrR family transcriptional regulator
MSKDDKEKVIVAAATRIFSRKGYTNARMSDIATEAGMSYGSLYHYYKSKDALFDIIVGDWWAKLFSELERIKQSESPIRGKLEAIVRYLLSAYATDPHQVEIYITEISRGFVYHFESRDKENFIKVFSLCEELFYEGQERGDLRKDISANHMANIFLGAIDSFLSTMVFGRVSITPGRQERIVNSVLGVFLHGAMIWY